MSFEDYNTLEDLAFSRSFRNWVLNPEGPEADFWINWAAHNPDKTELIHQAKAAVHALQLNFKSLSEGAIDAEIRKVLQKIKDGRINAVREIPLRTSLLGRRPARLWTAAAVIAAIVILWILVGVLHRHK